MCVFSLILNVVMIYMLCVIFVGMLEFVVVVFVVIYEVGFLVLFVFI